MDALGLKMESITLYRLKVSQVLGNKTSPPAGRKKSELVQNAHQLGHFGELEVINKIYHQRYL